ncbi:hypothetical protein CGERO_03030 [Corynebacterium gerontici]|uniref:Uncharacterized protein n=1 Tax=Corynebacterium gerontici TaxID=2079234 RepID=A0A3G6IYS6_9CORY|nr:hypothetical protein CGERO_03030 [Corynebacterium gerontici]
MVLAAFMPWVLLLWVRLRFCARKESRQATVAIRIDPRIFQILAAAAGVSGKFIRYSHLSSASLIEYVMGGDSSARLHLMRAMKSAEPKQRVFGSQSNSSSA